jgi:F0F1-type ATP synthase epsilon subunit
LTCWEENREPTLELIDDAAKVTQTAAAVGIFAGTMTVQPEVVTVSAVVGGAAKIVDNAITTKEEAAAAQKSANKI